MKLLSKNLLLNSIFYKKALIILGFCCFILSNKVAKAQINYISNGSFEVLDSCPQFGNTPKYAKGWDTLKIGGGGPKIMSSCTNSSLGIPLNGVGYQYARTGISYAEEAFFPIVREYLKGRLFDTLNSGINYCVTFYVNTTQNQIYYNPIDAIQAYFDDGSLSTCSYCLAIATPQVSNPTGNILSDTLNWMKIQGSFVATGNESYITIGNFKNDANTNSLYGNNGSEYYIDDVSVIESNSKIKADNDTIINKGDTITLGKSIEGMPVDWYDLQGNLLAASSTINISPTTTKSYVVKMDLCGNVTYDTVVVSVSTGVEQLVNDNEKLVVYPNPASLSLVISHRTLVNTIEVMDVLGRILMVRQAHHDGISVFGHAEERSISINVETLPSGIYFIKATDEKGNLKVGKFVKE